MSTPAPQHSMWTDGSENLDTHFARISGLEGEHCCVKVPPLSSSPVQSVLPGRHAGLEGRALHGPAARGLRVQPGPWAPTARAPPVPGRCARPPVLQPGPELGPRTWLGPHPLDGGGLSCPQSGSWGGGGPGALHRGEGAGGQDPGGGGGAAALHRVQADRHRRAGQPRPDQPGGGGGQDR